MRPNYWKRTDTKTLLEHPRVKVVEDDVVLPDGHKTKYLRYEGLQDYVTLIAKRADKIAMIREYSYPHDEHLWQFPEGSIEVGEPALAAANRELAEEASLGVKEWRELGINYDHHRRTTVKCHVFLGRDAHEVEKLDGDIEEQGTTLHWFSLDELKNMIVEGDVVQKNALAALGLYLAYVDSKAAK